MKGNLRLLSTHIFICFYEQTPHQKIPKTEQMVTQSKRISITLRNKWTYENALNVDDPYHAFFYQKRKKKKIIIIKIASTDFTKNSFRYTDSIRGGSEKNLIQ